jgi:hypothetical protein
MIENSYEEKLEQLKKGEIESLYIEREEFDLFNAARIVRDDKKFFRGEAHLGGNVTYFYDTTVV